MKMRWSRAGPVTVATAPTHDQGEAWGKAGPPRRPECCGDPSAPSPGTWPARNAITVKHVNTHTLLLGDRQGGTPSFGAWVVQLNKGQAFLSVSSAPRTAPTHLCQHRFRAHTDIAYKRSHVLLIRKGLMFDSKRFSIHVHFLLGFVVFHRE